MRIHRSTGIIIQSHDVLTDLAGKAGARAMKLFPLMLVLSEGRSGRWQCGLKGHYGGSGFRSDAVPEPEASSGPECFLVQCDVRALCCFRCFVSVPQYPGGFREHMPRA